jgi:hypothetical protein
LRKANALAVAVVVIVPGQAHEQRTTRRYCSAGRVDKRHEVDCCVEPRSDVANEIELRDAVVSRGHIARQGSFRRNRSRVFDDALRTAVDVTRREGEVLR